MKSTFAGCLLVLALTACGEDTTGHASRYDEQESADAQQPGETPTRAGHTRDGDRANDDEPSGGAAPAGKLACGSGRGGINANKLSIFSSYTHKLITTPQRVIAQGTDEVESVSKATGSRSWYHGPHIIKDIAVDGDRLYVVADGQVWQGPVSGGSLQIAWYDATGGSHIVASGGELFVGSQLGDSSPLYRGSRLSSSVWVHAPMFFGLTATGTTIYSLNTYIDDGARVTGVYAIDKRSDAGTGLFAVDGLPRGFWADDNEIIVAMEDGVFATKPPYEESLVLAEVRDLREVAVTAEHAYFAAKGTIGRARRDGSGVEMLYDGDCSITSLAVDDDGIFFTTIEGTRSVLHQLARP